MDPDKKVFKAKEEAADDGTKFVNTQCVMQVKFDERLAAKADEIFDKFYKAELGL